jgi:hypothetical protein
MGGIYDLRFTTDDLAEGVTGAPLDPALRSG